MSAATRMSRTLVAPRSLHCTQTAPARFAAGNALARRRGRPGVRCHATADGADPPSAKAEAPVVDPEACKRAKRKLWAAVSTTKRGLDAGALERSEVEEAQVAVESFERDELDVQALAGNWRLVYTTAPDVVSVLQLERTGAVQVADICQEFTSDGSVTNVINLSVPWLLQPVAAGGGLTLRVAASYEVKGPRTLALAFNSARVGELRISDLLQGLLAPAVLPRTPLQHELLMRLQEAALEVPLRGEGVMAPPPALSGGMAYQLTYLDDDTLIGRAAGSGGSFIFQRMV